MRAPSSYQNYMYIDLLTAPSIQYERLIGIFLIKYEENVKIYL